MISIIIPFYNTDKYLEQCLASVMGQTFSDYEVLMIDDGSIDNSREIAEKYAKQDSRFKLLNKEHVGFPRAKNIGLDNAKGEYICFLDSDDYLESTYLELLLKGLIESNADICCCGINDFRDTDSPRTLPKKEFDITIYHEERMKRMFFVGISTFMWNKIYKRELFDGLRFEDVEALSDTLLCPLVIEKAHSLSTINQYLIYHRVHNENMTYKVRNYSNTYWEHRLNVYMRVCSYLTDKFPQYTSTYRNIFRSELAFIRPHISLELYNKYIEREDVKSLLTWKRVY